jgi:hypothetical protein
MSRAAGAGVVVWSYRRAVRLYPRSFRDEYGDDLVLLLADQLRDEGVPRVAGRAFVDLVLSVPQRHLESRVPVTRWSALPILFGVLSLSAVIVGLVVGRPLVVGLCLLAALAFGALAVLAARRDRPLADGHPASSNWWKLLAAGVGSMAALIVITTATGELAEGWWFVAMLVGLASLLLVAAGVVLAVVHLASRGGGIAGAGHH